MKNFKLLLRNGVEKMLIEGKKRGKIKGVRVTGLVPTGGWVLRMGVSVG